MNISQYLTKQLQPGEEVLRVVRRHGATMASSVGVAGVLVLLDFFLVAWWFQHRSWGPIGFVSVLAVGILLTIRGVYIWRHNVLAITTQRVIDIDQRGFFERHVAEARLEAIQDVRYTIRGFWPTILRFGTIVVQTAGSTTNLELSAVSHPVELQQLIIDLQHQAGAKSAELQADELVTVVDRLKAELGVEGFQRLLRRQPPQRHG